MVEVSTRSPKNITDIYGFLRSTLISITFYTNTQEENKQTLREAAERKNLFS